jgi:hypothetical protein
MLSPPRRTKHLALLFVGGEIQSEILRFAQNDSEGLRMTAWHCERRNAEASHQEASIFSGDWRITISGGHFP